MRVVAKKDFQRTDDTEAILWECKVGDKLDVEKVLNTTIYKVINRTRENQLNEVFMNDTYIKELI